MIEIIERSPIEGVRNNLKDTAFKKLTDTDLEKVVEILEDPVWRAKENMQKAAADAEKLLEDKPDSPNGDMARNILSAWPQTSDLFQTDLTEKFPGAILSAALLVENAREKKASKI